MRVSVSLGLWLDRPADEVLTTAEAADRCGYPELWIGEMATYDAISLATSVAHRTERIELTVGPLAVAVRTPANAVMGAASVAALGERRVGVALGSSSPIVVSAWHGREAARAGRRLDESAQACRQLMSGERSDLDGEVVRSRGFRLRLPPPGGPLTVAAFGPTAIRAAAHHADRMVVNLVSTEAVAELRSRLDEAARERPRPSLAVWVPTAVDPGEAAWEQLRRAIVAYLRAPGYTEMFDRAGFGEVVAAAAEGRHPRELLDAVPREMASAVGAIGGLDEVEARFAGYLDAGADEIVLVPSATDDDPGGVRTLEQLAAQGRGVRT